MACCFIGFLFVAWLALTINIVNPISMGTHHKTIDQFLDQATAIFSRKRPATATEPKTSSEASSGVDLDIENTRLGETRIDVFSKGLMQKDPVSIRVEGLSLSVSLSKFEWGLLGIIKFLRQEKIEKQLLKDIDLVFPSGELTAILGGSGVGKVRMFRDFQSLWAKGGAMK